MREGGNQPGVASPTSPADQAGSGKQDSDRFFCPFPGCNRSFAELWRLKVHYRAPPDIRGSGAC
ncbi:protein TIC 21, chloroplastic [Haematococcus lacustris]|uniref:Protein TIC 21, chloroplastic n=1 Tax=Haematococcus lacustris TaxID=44745 RepID=A0A699Z8X5_HAELA|nr:protein TIC 21, chloroplastic [Haematococcus lacustris]